MLSGVLILWGVDAIGFFEAFRGERWGQEKTAAAVSSQEDSIARIFIFILYHIIPKISRR